MEGKNGTPPLKTEADQGGLLCSDVPFAAQKDLQDTTSNVGEITDPAHNAQSVPPQSPSSNGSSPPAVNADASANTFTPKAAEPELPISSLPTSGENVNGKARMPPPTGPGFLPRTPWLAPGFSVAQPDRSRPEWPRKAALPGSGVCCL